MKIAVIGGGLQGMEVCYLARKAGWQALLVDKQPDPPARGLAHWFICRDVTDPGTGLAASLAGVDLVMPALENHEALKALRDWQVQSGLPLAFDLPAFELSASKNRSNDLFDRLKAPIPAPWPDCGFPVMIKPDTASGSKDARLIRSEQEMALVEKHIGPVSDWVIQQFVDGPSYSLEIIGRPGSYTTYQATGLEMDRDYDCKRVLAPAGLDPVLGKELKRQTIRIARAMNLTGIMDIEVILHENQLKILEIDARFPSQTPIAVFHSTGVNLLEELAALFLPEFRPSDPSASSLLRHASLEHIRVTADAIQVAGEGILKTQGTPFRIETDFFGADEAVTTFEPGIGEWVATLIFTGKDAKAVSQKRQQTFNAIQQALNIRTITDEYPREYPL